MRTAERPSWVSPVVFVLLLLLLDSERGSGRLDLDLEAPLTQHQHDNADTDSCWVFTHMNKSGGTTVKRLLRPSLDENGISYGLYDSPQWKMGLDFLQNDMLERGHKMIWGGYTEGIRPYGMFKCKWFTVLRHPVNRLISAYFYCKTNEHDALCGIEALTPDTVDLRTFARHWSNFGLRQLALAYVQPDAVMTSPFISADYSYSNRPGWLLLKRYLDGPNHPDGRRVPDATMRYLLEPAQKMMGEQYAAIGILEDWDNSLELFNVALEFPNFNWTTKFRASGVQNDIEDEMHRLEADIIKLAHTDAEIKQFLRLDMLLYEHALAIHRRQLRQYRIVP